MATQKDPEIDPVDWDASMERQGFFVTGKWPEAIEVPEGIDWMDELRALCAQDAVLAYMVSKNKPLTLETYVTMAWPGKTLQQLGAEELASIPWPLRSADSTIETEAEGLWAGARRTARYKHQSAQMMAGSRPAPATSSVEASRAEQRETLRVKLDQRPLGPREQSLLAGVSGRKKDKDQP